MEIETFGGEVDVETAILPGLDSFALKVSTGFYGNAALGLPSLNGMMALLSARTGLVEAVLLDNGYLTDLRTAAAGAVAARALAPDRVETACVMGTGLQARMQIAALQLVRPLNRVLVWGRDAGKARSCAEDIAGTTGVAALAVKNPGEAVAAAQVVVTTTPARPPILQAEWLHPGLHITAMGSDADYKRELGPNVLKRADLYVCDRVSQCETLGELRAAMADGTWRGARPPELGDVLTGRHTGRTSQDQITICDLTGTGAQDTAIATLADGLIRGGGIGHTIPT